MSPGPLPSGITNRGFIILCYLMLLTSSVSRIIYRNDDCDFGRVYNLIDYLHGSCLYFVIYLLCFKRSLLHFVAFFGLSTYFYCGFFSITNTRALYPYSEQSIFEQFLNVNIIIYNFKRYVQI